MKPKSVIIMDLDDEIARLKAENRRLKGIGRRLKKRIEAGLGSRAAFFSGPGRRNW